MKIAIDGMGLDLGLGEVVKACNQFCANNKDVKLILVALEAELSKYQLAKEIEVVYATEVMEMEEGALAIRRKKGSSMVKAVELVLQKKADAVVSCGSTGAFLTTSAMQLRFIPGIERAALVGGSPNIKGDFTTILDLGANAENTANHLIQFALMGHLYAKHVLKRANPRIGLLNIGSEAKKGDALRQEVYQALSELPIINFIGNIEGKDVLLDMCDVLVTDGFTGNILLKTLEGSAKTMFQLIKEALLGSSVAKVGALLIKKPLIKLKRQLDTREIGGALLLGVNGVVIKGHGNSDAYAIEKALYKAKAMVEANIVELIAADIQRLKLKEQDDDNQ